MRQLWGRCGRGCGWEIGGARGVVMEIRVGSTLKDCCWPVAVRGNQIRIASEIMIHGTS